MALFITYASYSKKGVTGLLASPEDRTAAIQSMLDEIGGKIVALYMTTGEHDIVVVHEAPDRADTVAMAMATRASGAVSEIKTVQAWSGAEFSKIAAKGATLATAYSPPGG